MKKIIIACTIMALTLVMAMPCFAAAYYWPNLPETELKYWYIYESSPEDIAYNTHAPGRIESSDGLWATIVLPQCDVYYLEDGVWEYWETLSADEVYIYTGNLAYDTTGLYATNSNDIFENGVIRYQHFKDVISKAKATFKVKNVVDVLALGAGTVVCIVFMWWGARKLTRAVLSAFKKGKISV